MKKNKIGNKLLAVMRAIDQVNGIISVDSDAVENHYISMSWIHDWFRGFYMRWDQQNDFYLIEWRGDVPSGNQKSTRITEKVVGYHDGSLITTAKVLLKGVKKYKKHLKEEGLVP